VLSERQLKRLLARAARLRKYDLYCRAVDLPVDSIARPIGSAATAAKKAYPKGRPSAVVHADGRLSPDSFRPGLMPATVAVGQDRTLAVQQMASLSMRAGPDSDGIGELLTAFIERLSLHRPVHVISCSTSTSAKIVTSLTWSGALMGVRSNIRGQSVTITVQNY